MKKLLLFVFIFFIQLSVFAEELPTNYFYYKAIEMGQIEQTRLDLTAKQEKIRKIIISEYQPIIIQRIDELCAIVDMIKSLAKSDNCTLEQLEALKKEYDAKVTELCEIYLKYETSFESMLTKKQLKKYRKLHQADKAQLKNEIKQHKKEEKNK